MIFLVLPDISIEDQLLARARRGDNSAVTEIYDHYFEPVYQFIRMRVAEPQVAEDLTSEVFLRMLNALRGRRPPQHSLRGWLFRVARNILHDHYGRQQKITMTTLDEWLPAPDAEGPESRVFSALDAEHVRRAIGQLSDEQQEVLILRFGQMLSLQETADIMGKRINAVKSLQFRATSRLREIIS